MKFGKTISAVILGTAAMLLPAAVTIRPGEAYIETSDDVRYNGVANDLSLHLETITSVRIPVVKKGKKPAGKTYPIRIGSIPPGVKAAFRPQEAHYLITPQGAWFYGDEDRGAQFAVYDFLENSLGVRWPSGTDIACRKQNPVTVEKTEGVWIPKITLRTLRSSRKQDVQRWWKSRLRGVWGKDWIYGAGDAEYGKWWKIYGKTHPEFFAMNINGMRGPAPSRLKGLPLSGDVDAYQGKDLRVGFCCSCESYLDEVIRLWKQKKDRSWLNFSQPDVQDFELCYCDKCRALDGVQIRKGEKFSGYRLADRYVHMTNELCKKVLPLKPDLKILSEIYCFSQRPPVKMKILYPDNVIYRLVPGDFTMKGLDILLDGWKKAGLKKFFYRPNRHGHYITLIPAGYEEYFFKVLQKMLKAGCMGFDYDCANTYLHSGQWFSDYVLLKAMQDPDKDFSFWEKHYMLAFEPAEKEVSAYYRFWREEIWNKRLEKDIGRLEKEGKYYNFGRGLVRRLGSYYRESDFDTAESLLQKALDRNDLPADVRARIERLMTENRHSRLIFRAVTGKDDQASLALLKFREENGYEIYPHCETYWGDVCGLKRVKDLRDFTPPFLKTPVFWHFKLDPDDVGLTEQWYRDDSRKISRWGAVMATNNCWETPFRHYKNISREIRKKTAEYDGVAWYGVTLKNLPPDWKARKVFLYFGAVDESCQVYVNGKKAGERIASKSTDWHTAFFIEITDMINWKSAGQTIVVRVEDKGGNGGIWKPVFLVSKAQGGNFKIKN